MDEFCGQRFWDWNLTWNTGPNQPDFTCCFESTVLVWIPAAFLWFLAPLDIYVKWDSQPKLIPRNALNITKSGLNACLVLVYLSVLFYNFSLIQSQIAAFPVQYVTPIVRVLTFGLSLFHLRFGNKKGVLTSGIQFFFWVILAICDLFGFRTQIMNSSNAEKETDTFEFVTTIISYLLVIAMLLLNCWVDVAPEFSEPKETEPCPESRSSYLSQLTFNWYFPMGWKGYKKPLEHDDIWDLNNADKSRALTSKFDMHWNKLKATNKEKNVSLLPVMFGTFGTTFVAGAVFKLFQDLATFASPEILKLLIAFVTGDEEQWKGYFYAALMSIAAMAQTLLMAQYFHRMLLVGMRIRTVLISAIFRKALVLSNSARGTSTVGEIVNLMAVDATRIEDMMPHICILWSAPFQIILAVYLLWDTLGPSIMAGVALMILMIPVNSYIANRMEKLQVIQMKKKDQRVKLMNEILSGIKVLKLYAWEKSFQEQVLKIRDAELKALRWSAYLHSAVALVWTCTPFLVSLVTFGTYVLIDENNILDAQKAFVSLSLFNIIRRPLALFPMTITAAIQANVSLKRLNKYMNSEEINNSAVAHDARVDDQITIEDGTFSWSSASTSDPESVVLKNINVNIPEGSLCAIVGEVGCGKSSLLAAILGELEKKSGKVNTKGSIAYVSQQAWIQNATLRDNVLFSLPIDWSRYEKIIDSCALKPDLEILPAGDKTEIGEKGINLSGGQKQRVALARAAYHNADIYLLDDPLSAVDSHVGKHIFEHVIGPRSMLKNKTRVLVTHGITHLPEVDFIIVLSGGKITEQGTYKELVGKKGDFSEFLIRHLEQMDQVENGELSIIQDIEQVVGAEKVNKIMTRQASRMSEPEITGEGQPTTALQRSISRDRPQTPARQTSALEKQNGHNGKNPLGEKIIEVEKSAIGSTDKNTYKYYAKSIGYLLTFVCMLIYTSYETFGTLSNVWLSEWSNVSPVNGTQDIEKRNFYLMVFGLFGTGQVCAFLVAGTVLVYGTLRASSILHRDMLERILRAPASFFDTTPTGRIVNRFAKDVDVCDTSLPEGWRDFFVVFLKVISTFVVITFSSPYFIIVVIPTVILYVVLQRFYVASSRQIRRLESISRSPVYSHFSETINGCTTIRAFGAQERFILQSEAHVDYNQRARFISVVANRWLGIRLELLGNLLIVFVSLFAVLGRGTISPGIVGLSLSYALQVTMVMNFSVRMGSMVETNMIAVERLKEYSTLPQEAPAEIPERKPSSKWPESGGVSFEGYQTRYREGLDLVLRGVTVNVEPAEKVGIVGRTGSGKSTLALGLFRLIESAGGSIKIDGIDISKIGLEDLRSRLTIIPQDPVLFSGSLRINLDPFSQYHDETLWRALDLAHLKPFVKGLATGLEYEVTEGGQNLSVGQRQLICLARAVLRKSKVLVLDEATAQVDLDTDELIQQTIRSEFKDSTVLTIAHRINTIMDYTRVMVLDKGEVREFDTPETLLKEKTSMFYKMVQDAGLVQ